MSRACIHVHMCSTTHTHTHTHLSRDPYKHARVSMQIRQECMPLMLRFQELTCFIDMPIYSLYLIPNAKSLSKSKSFITFSRDLTRGRKLKIDTDWLLRKQ